MKRKRRKLSADKQAKLDRVHLRDCPAQHNIEFDCQTCREIELRKASALAAKGEK